MLTVGKSTWCTIMRTWVWIPNIHTEAGHTHSNEPVTTALLTKGWKVEKNPGTCVPASPEHVEANMRSYCLKQSGRWGLPEIVFWDLHGLQHVYTHPPTTNHHYHHQNTKKINKIQTRNTSNTARQCLFLSYACVSIWYWALKHSLFAVSVRNTPIHNFNSFTGQKVSAKPRL